MPLLAQRFVFISLVVTGLFVTAPAQTAGGSQPLQAVESVSASEPLRDGIQIQAGSAVVRITEMFTKSLARLVMNIALAKIGLEGGSSADSVRTPQTVAPPMRVA